MHSRSIAIDDLADADDLELLTSAQGGAPATSVALARSFYEYAQARRSSDIIHTVATGWHIRDRSAEAKVWAPVAEAKVRALVHSFADRLFAVGKYVYATATPDALGDSKRQEAGAWTGAGKSLQNSKVLANVLTELKALPPVHRDIADFDREPDWLAVANGVLELDTGHFRDYDDDDLLTTYVDIYYDAAAEAPTWERYLASTFIKADGSPDPDYVDFMQRLVGYAITGHTREHIFPVLYGGGSNGKSVFIETLKTLFAPITSVTKVETFEESTGGIPNDLARLKSARLVIASEGKAGVPMDEARIKRLTGGDTMVARFLHREFLEFVPSFTIFLATNYKPTFRGQDEGLWRRVRLLPFYGYFPKTPGSPRIADLHEQLVDEGPGILAWAGRGALEWYRRGLRDAQIITDETAAYKAESDRLGDFIGDWLDVTGHHSDAAKASEVYKTYVHWAEEERETRPYGRNTFMAMLGERAGITKAQSGRHPIFRGVRVLSDAERRVRGQDLARELRPLSAVGAARA